MAIKLEPAERRPLAITLKDSRDKDAAQATLDHEPRRLAILAKITRLRAARSAKSTEVPRSRSNVRNGHLDLMGAVHRSAEGKGRKNPDAKSGETSA